MEGDSEESDEDVQGQDKPIVVWEKCIQQSIFVDISDDESLHLSDLESSLDLHFSKSDSFPSEASIHLSGSAELSELDDTSSESSIVSHNSVKAVESKSKSKSKSSTFFVSSQRPNTMQDEPPLKQGCDDPGQDTGDEDQEDLPYDGDLRSDYFNHTASSEGNSEGGSTIHGSPDLPCLPAPLQEDANFKQETSFEASKSAEVVESCPRPADFSHVLLQHFPLEELLQSGRLIEAETLPEVSLLESVDNSVLSLAPTLSCTTIQSKHTESFAEESISASKNGYLEEKTEKKMDNLKSSVTDKNASSSASSNQSCVNICADEVIKANVDKDDQNQRVPLVRTRSFSEMKYGQGQVHYPLPDFSKIASKVKIPKAPSGPIRSVQRCSKTMHKAHSSPGMLEVISRVLEDSIPPREKPCVFTDNDEQTPSTLVHHLQAEYDKLMTRYADAERVINERRRGANTPLSSDLILYSEHNGSNVDGDDSGEDSVEGHLATQFLQSENLSEKQEGAAHCRTINEVTTAFSCQHEDAPSDGEKMTTELRDIIRHFMEKVEEFKFSVNSMAISTAEQQMMLRSMMEAQDQLERKYICKKDEHRALEMQNYMGLCRNTGIFDPNRLVEGDIFRIGMHLEDIKEMIDKNVFEQISPPHSSSTPTPVAVPLHVNPGTQCMPIPSPSPCLHEGHQAGFSKVKQEEVEASDAHVTQSSETVAAEPVMKKAGRSICCSRELLGSLEGLDIQTSADEDGTEEQRSSLLSEVLDQSNILGTSSTSRQRQWEAKSFPNPDSERDLGDCVSLAVELSFSADAPQDSDNQSISEPPFNTSCVSQRLINPETDSGFGSSYLNNSSSGPFQPNLLTGSVQFQTDGTTNSDCGSSCSNLQTDIHLAAQTGHQRAHPHPCVQTLHCGAAAAVELWVQSTTKEASVKLQADQTDTDHKLPSKLHHHISEPMLNTTMDTVGRQSPLNSCSCNSEAFLALQTEVFRLKKDLKEGLVQLPHLAQRMDYLTSKYRQERQSRRSKTRSHQTTACRSVGKSSSRNVSKLSSSQLRIEDWISSDIDASKSKDTVSTDSSCSDIMLQLYDSPVGSRQGRRSACSVDEFPDKHQQSKLSKRGMVGKSTLKGNHSFDSESQAKQTQQSIKGFYSKDSWSLRSSPSLQKPLLQVSYGSSSSLPASYKVKEAQLQSTSCHRKRSTQSDTALLPNNVYFQQTPPPLSVSSKSVVRTSRRRGKKEEDMNRTLDQAIEVARSMKRTADHMAQRLSADLAKAQLHRKSYNMQPQGGRRPLAF